ncbi:MAG: SAM-dependent DNA methyltransferase [Planctomycetes bacterium]|nr:SAM-dependent DNA methyltransferase [Planctomycetota bacterium]
MAKSKTVAEFGDFQTPVALARQVCRLLSANGVRPAALLEPTCGLGSFIFAGLDEFPAAREALGIDINPDYVERALTQARVRPDASKVRVLAGNFFGTNWRSVISSLPEPTLVVGNLPWVTNAELGALGSQNLPEKSNFQQRTGMDAMTGKANFDISEWMLIQILGALEGRRGSLAMLCKSAVARKALGHSWSLGLGVGESAIYRIDAAKHFGAAVDAVLLVMTFGVERRDYRAKVFESLDSVHAQATIGYEDGCLLADIEAHRKWKHLCGTEPMKWRSGVKHDCSKVMEFVKEDSRYRNGLGECVSLESRYMFPMLKSSGVARGCDPTDIRWMLVTQTSVGQDTAEIAEHAPRTWEYLQRHAGLLNARGSSIYKDKPPFSVFGVGDYTFAPWKVAISGFYKRLAFARFGPVAGKPMVFDDTSYFLPCATEPAADYLMGLLNSRPAQSILGAFVFWDAKRPITAELLRRISLRSLATELGSLEEFDLHFAATPADSPIVRRRRASAAPALLR